MIWTNADKGLRTVLDTMFACHNCNLLYYVHSQTRKDHEKDAALGLKQMASHLEETKE